MAHFQVPIKFFLKSFRTKTVVLQVFWRRQHSVWALEHVAHLLERRPRSPWFGWRQMEIFLQLKEGNPFWNKTFWNKIVKYTKIDIENPIVIISIQELQKRVWSNFPYSERRRLIYTLARGSTNNGACDGCKCCTARIIFTSQTSDSANRYILAA